MKFNKKLVVATLSSALGLGIVGSITGTVAWYQYSTRSTAAFIGTSAGVSTNLQIKAEHGSAFKNRLSNSDVLAELPNSGHSTDGIVNPLTTALNTSETSSFDTSKLKSNPTYQDFAYSKWRDAKVTDYVQFKLTLKYINKSSGTDQAISGKNIYLSDLEIAENAVSGKLDISEAVRVHLHTESKNLYLSKTGVDTVLGGNLDIGGPKGLDKDGKFDYEGDGTQEIGDLQAYGDTSFTQKTYKLDEVKSIALGATDENGLLDVTVSIWIEGWQKLYSEVATVANETDVDGLYTKNSSGEYVAVEGTGQKAAADTQYYELSDIWNPSNYINSQFKVGLEFQAEDIA